ncbi:MAG: hypothetical protein JWO36_5828 [Myxococcales bacterium]|nr:hypothetical protein [Myxococcales bacterium]
MGGVIVFVLFLAVVSTYLGYKLLRSVMFPTRPAPPIPVARDANPDMAHRAGAKLGRFTVGIGRAIAFVFGLGLMVWPWLLMWLISSMSDGGHNSKGRVLRIRNRARLPERAEGAGWTDGAVTLQGSLAPQEQAVLGDLWLLTARMEHASIAAFSQLSLHLAALGAPARLLEWSHRAALEEIRHAQRCYAIASAITGQTHRAGPIVELATTRAETIDLRRLAVGSLVDGCLAEGMAADVAARSASRCEEPAMRATLDMIAREEQGHAELAWAVLEWAIDQGGETVHRAVAARLDKLAREVSPKMPPIAGLDDAVLARYGVLDQDTLGQIALARLATVQDRARGLLGLVDHRLAA